MSKVIVNLVGAVDITVDDYEEVTILEDGNLAVEGEDGNITVFNRKFWRYFGVID